MTRLSLAGQIDPRPRPPQGVLVLVVLVVLIGGAYWMTTRGGVFRHAAAATPVASPATPSDAALEDAANHLRHIQQVLVHIQEDTHRIDQRLNQVSSVLDANYLRLERQRLDAADQLSNSVLRNASEALDELELTNQSLKNGRK